MRISVVADALHWTATCNDLSGLVAPDAVARELAGVADGADPGVVLHSTSWRHTGTELIVTYALFPDLRSEPGELLRLHLVTGPGPLQPSPVTVTGAHVAAHAVRHLADLAADRDPHVVFCSRAHPRAWQLLCEHAGAVHVDHPLTSVAAVAAMAADPLSRNVNGTAGSPHWHLSGPARAS